LRGNILINISTADNDVRYVPEERDANGRCAIMHASRYQWLTSVVDVSNASVLDFGCGSGYGPGVLTDKGARVLGIDISAAAIDYAKTRFPRASFLVHDLTDSNLIAQVSERFDIIVSFDVIEHVEKWWTFLENIRRLMKPGGVAFVGCPNRAAHFDFNPLWNPSHMQEFTPAQLEWAARTQFPDVTVLGQRFLDPAVRACYTARPLGPAWYMKEALLQTPLRTPVRNLVSLLHGPKPPDVKARGSKDPAQSSKIVFEKINMRDTAALREPFGLLAICR
jgi:SAM-dependent methyltransferase